MTTLETLLAKTKADETWTKEDWKSWARHLGIIEPSTSKVLSKICGMLRRQVTVKTSRQEIDAVVAEEEQVDDFACRMARIDGMGPQCHPTLHTLDGERVQEWSDVKGYDKLVLAADPNL